MGEGLFQPMHLLIILIVVLIVFGPGKLPEVGAALGKSIREFKRGAEEMRRDHPEPPPASPGDGRHDQG